MIGLRRARAVPFVVAEEDVLEARLVAGQRDDRITRGRLDDRIRGSLHRQVHPMPVMQRLNLDHSVERLERLDRNRRGECDRHLVTLDSLHLRDVPNADETPIADDPDGRARFFDFAQDVRREKDGAPLIARLEHHAIEFLLVQWIEAAGRLVEDQQARAMHEGLDQHHLALVSGRVLAELATGIELEAVDELLEIGVIDTSTQMGEVLEDLPARQIGIESRLTGHVADEALGLQRLLPAIESGDSRRAGVGVQESHQQPDGRRLACAIGAQETEDVALLDLERDLDDAALAAVALGKFLDFDDGRHVSPFQPNQKCSVDSSVSVSDPFGMPRIRSNASVKDATDRWTIANVMDPAWRAMK